MLSCLASPPGWSRRLASFRQSRRIAEPPGRISFRQEPITHGTSYGSKLGPAAGQNLAVVRVAAGNVHRGLLVHSARLDSLERHPPRERRRGKRNEIKRDRT